ncbi:hypothetical protein B0H14DRAFT_3571394 [Mycena olivaceomarginata]|nr:hypothetical protein B0H14DRAFT_3571394 [Mycena olivaceomarginata]
MHSSNSSTSTPAATENSNTCHANSQGESVPQGRVCLSSCALVWFARRHLIPEWQAEAQWGGGAASDRGAGSEGASSGSDLASCLNGRQVAQSGTAQLQGAAESPDVGMSSEWKHSGVAAGQAPEMSTRNAKVSAETRKTTYVHVDHPDIGVHNVNVHRLVVFGQVGGTVSFTIRDSDTDEEKETSETHGSQRREERPAHLENDWLRFNPNQAVYPEGLDLEITRRASASS